MSDAYSAVQHSHPPPTDWNGPHEELFEWQQIGRYVLFALRSIRRRPFLFSGVLVGMVGLAAAAVAVFPRTYEVETRLLAQKSSVLAVRADSDKDQPTRAAAALILDRETLNSLIQQTDLIAEWFRRRPPALRLKDAIWFRLFGKPDDARMLESLRGLLEKNLEVWTTPDGTVTIRLHWPDGQMAYRIVDAAEQTFLEKRHVLEISTIAEQISILERHSAELQADLEKQVAELQQLREKSRPKTARVVPHPVLPRAVRPEVANLKTMLDAKRRAIADLEAFRERHLVELQQRLQEQRAVYSAEHPAILDLQQTIQTLQRESPQLTALRDEEADLRRQLAMAGEDTEIPVQPMSIPADLFRSERGEDSAVDYAAAKVGYAAQEYARMQERIRSVRLDLDTARAAFKYRYSVIAPAEVPRGPIKPKVALVMIAATLSGLFLAILATTAADLRAGALLELWQLRSVLGAKTAVVEVRMRK